MRNWSWVWSCCFAGLAALTTAEGWGQVEKAATPHVVASNPKPPEPELKRFELGELRRRKLVTIEVNDPALRPFPAAFFDGDPATLQRSEKVNPLVVTLRFVEPVLLRAVRLHPSHATRYDWTLSPGPKSGGLTIERVGDEWSRLDLPQPVATQVVKIEIRRVMSDDYVHVKELELYGDLPDRLARASRNEPAIWPKPFPAPTGMQDQPGPWSDPADLTVWPNQTSRANSDPWIALNHDRIRRMSPRVLLLNVSNKNKDETRMRGLAKQLIAALAEGSRYHGYDDSEAPAFLNYQIFKYVALPQAGAKVGNSDLSPLKKNRKSGEYEGYSGFFSQGMGDRIGVRDPRDSKRFLRLDELVDAGYVHEVWMFAEHGDGAGYEVIEMKPAYDETFVRMGNRFVQAGNGGDAAQEWTGRSVRIGHVNPDRGIGCFLESLSHGIEGTSNSSAIPYFTKYFREYADFNLDKRFGLPFDSLYAVAYEGKNISYPNERTMVVTSKGKKHRVDNYIAAGGSAHFPPNARNHYDLQNDRPVLSTIEDWRIGSGPGGKDRAKPFTNAALQRYNDLAPDCMGPWLIYWRQNFPGLDNKSRDAEGRPMKNWWPFLFY